jgi:NAD(P)-dependent dehydrogenase (short-subunit alcohol dehydrogenase family)
VLDLSSFASVHAFADTFLAHYTRLDILFANAGFAVPPSSGVQTTAEVKLISPPSLVSHGFTLQPTHMYLLLLFLHIGF